MQEGRRFPGFLQAVLLLLGVVGAMIVFCIPVAIVSLITERDLAKNPLVLSGVQGGAILVVLLVGYGLARAPFRNVFPLAPVRPFLVVPVTLTVLGVGILLSEFDNVLSALVPLPRWGEQDMSELIAGGEGLVAALFLLAIVAPLTEEFLCRGLILTGFLARYSVRRALLLSSLLFMLMHLNPWQMPGAFVWGLLFGWWVIETRSLLPALYGHALANGFPVILIGILKIEIPGMVPVPGQRTVFQPLWLDALAVVLAALGIAVLFRAFSMGRREQNRADA